jgi:hypothetical protein
MSKTSAVAKKSNESDDSTLDYDVNQIPWELKFDSSRHSFLVELSPYLYKHERTRANGSKCL